MFNEFTKFSPSMALNPDDGRVRYPVSAVISDLPLFTNTTDSVDAPSPGPTSFLIGLLLLLEVEEEDVDLELSVQYASRNEGLLSVNGLLVLGFDCANTALSSNIELLWKYGINKSNRIPQATSILLPALESLSCHLPVTDLLISDLDILYSSFFSAEMIPAIELFILNAYIYHSISPKSLVLFSHL